MSETEHQSYKRSGGGVGDFWTRHLWQIQPIRDVLVLLAVLMIFWLGAKISVVTVPLLLAMLIAYLVEPVVQRVTRISWISRQGAASAIIVLAGLLVVVPATVGGIFAVGQGLSTLSQLSENIMTLDEVVRGGVEEDELDRLPGKFWQGLAVQLDELRAASEEIRDQRRRKANGEALPEGEPEAEALPPTASTSGGALPPQNLNEDELAQQELAAEAVEEQVAEREAIGAAETEPLLPVAEAALVYAVFVEISDWARNNRELIAQKLSTSGFELFLWTVGLLMSLGALGFMAFLTAFFFFFISTGWGKVRQFWFSLIPEKRQGRTVELFSMMDEVIAGFVRGRLTIMVIQCVLFSIGYLLIGTPAAIILGVAVGVLSIVPYLALIGVPISILLMLLATDPSAGGTFRVEWWWVVFAPIGVYMLGQAADDYILTPLIQGKATGLDTPTVLFASLAGAALAGFYGLLIAIPVAACIKILMREVVWPRFKDWAEGRASDPLPIDGAPRAP